MSQQPARSIASYFSKVPSSPTSPVAKTTKAVAQVTSPTSPQARTIATTSSAVATTVTPDGGLEKRTITTTSVNGKDPAPGTSPINGPSTTGSAVKRTGGFLSDAARRAIDEGVAEGSKRVKVDVPAKPVADVFRKAAAGPNKPTSGASLTLPRSESREELRTALSSHAKAKDLLQLELDHMGEDWLLALQEEFTKPYFLQLKEFVTNEQRNKKIFPPAEDIYSWSRFCPLKDVRVVIVGQDPYHDDGQAHGLAFSVRKGMRIPPSLRNIYKQMADDIPGFVPPKHGDLTEWAKHGVLMLNTSLTVRAHEAGSHSNRGWETFTAAVLKVITSRMAPTNLKNTDHVPGAKGVVFMAWGAHAQKMCAGVDKNKHLILKSAHPSPLAAMRGFFGNGHFKKANEWLRERYGADGGIDWKVLSADA